MTGSESLFLPHDEIESEQRQARQLEAPPKILIAKAYVHTSENRFIYARVPLAWPSIVDHDPEVNLSITRFLMTLQRLYEVYVSWGNHQSTTEDIKDAFKRLVKQWHTVVDSYQDCCRTSVLEVEEGLAEIHRLCGDTINHKGPNWMHMKDKQSQFSSTVRNDVIEKLKELRHFSNPRT